MRSVYNEEQLKPFIIYIDSDFENLPIKQQNIEVSSIIQPIRTLKKDAFLELPRNQTQRDGYPKFYEYMDEYIRLVNFYNGMVRCSLYRYLFLIWDNYENN